LHGEDGQQSFSEMLLANIVAVGRNLPESGAEALHVAGIVVAHIQLQAVRTA